MGNVGLVMGGHNCELVAAPMELMQSPSQISLTSQFRCIPTSIHVYRLS